MIIVIVISSRSCSSSSISSNYSKYIYSDEVPEYVNNISLTIHNYI